MQTSWEFAVPNRDVLKWTVQLSGNGAKGRVCNLIHFKTYNSTVRELVRTKSQSSSPSSGPQEVQTSLTSTTHASDSPVQDDWGVYTQAGVCGRIILDPQRSECVHDPPSFTSCQCTFYLLQTYAQHNTFFSQPNLLLPLPHDVSGSHIKQNKSVMNES